MIGKIWCLFVLCQRAIKTSVGFAEHNFAFGLALSAPNALMIEQMRDTTRSEFRRPILAVLASIVDDEDRESLARSGGSSKESTRRRRSGRGFVANTTAGVSVQQPLSCGQRD